MSGGCGGCVGGALAVPAAAPHSACLACPWRSPRTQYANCAVISRPALRWPVARGSGKTTSCFQLGPWPAVSCGESPVTASLGEIQSADLEGKGHSFSRTRPIYILKTENEVTLGGSHCPQTSCKEADAFKGVEAWGKTILLCWFTAWL